MLQSALQLWFALLLLWSTAKQRRRLLWPLYTVVRQGFLEFRRAGETVLHPSLKGNRGIGLHRHEKSKKWPRFDLDLGQQKVAECVENTKLTLACLQESFMTMSRCSQPQWALNPARVGFWCRMISFPYLWIAVHFTVWRGNRDK